MLGGFTQRIQPSLESRRPWRRCQEHKELCYFKKSEIFEMSPPFFMENHVYYMFGTCSWSGNSKHPRRSFSLFTVRTSNKQSNPLSKPRARPLVDARATIRSCPPGLKDSIGHEAKSRGSSLVRGHEARPGSSGHDRTKVLAGDWCKILVYSCCDW